MTNPNGQWSLDGDRAFLGLQEGDGSWSGGSENESPEHRCRWVFPTPGVAGKPFPRVRSRSSFHSSSPEWANLADSMWLRWSVLVILWMNHIRALPQALWMLWRAGGGIHSFFGLTQGWGHSHHLNHGPFPFGGSTHSTEEPLHEPECLALLGLRLVHPPQAGLPHTYRPSTLLH